MSSADSTDTAHLEAVLRHHFGLSSFRPLQLDAIQATLSKRDSLLVLPTGGGKSLSFMLPPLACGNCFTVVISPLIALARDQVRRLYARCNSCGPAEAMLLLSHTACKRWTSAWTLALRRW